MAEECGAGDELDPAELTSGRELSALSGGKEPSGGYLHAGREGGRGRTLFPGVGIGQCEHVGGKPPISNAVGEIKRARVVT